MHVKQKTFYVILRLELFHTWTKTWCHQQSLLEERWLGSCSEWYPGVVAEVGWILSDIIDRFSCF